MVLINSSIRYLAVGAAAIVTIGLFTASTRAQNSFTGGEFAVNDAGAATYSIPLTVPPGAGDFSPKLTLQYSSQAPNGIFGVGWTLSGVSSITRCPKNPAEEGDRIGVRNDASDVFCLDGQKLRAVSGVYGAAGTRYRTAIDTYARITSLGSVAGGPESFTLESKTGEIYTFGGTDTSRLEHPSKGVIRSWMVSEIRDRFNNRITFTYSKNLTLGEQLLLQVEYSNGRLVFSYEARPGSDQILKFDDGVQYGSTNSRVSAIDVAHKPLINGTAAWVNYKRYQLQYAQSQASQRSMLRSITECAADGLTCLPAASMTYRDGTPGVFQMVSGHGYQSPGMLSGQVSYGITDPSGTGHQSLYMFRNYEFRDVALWDVDGDGRTDVLTVTHDFSDSPPPAKAIIQYANGTVSESRYDYRNFIACFGDINGDGRSEAIKFDSITAGDNQPPYVRETLTNTEVAVGSFHPQVGPVSCRTIDVDGDGRAEVLVYDSDKRPHLLTYKAGSLTRLTVPIGTGYMANLVGDFNGDGKTDWVRGQASQNSVALPTYLSTGAGSAAVTGWSTETGGVACTGDFNGDGRSDVLGGVGKLFLSNGATVRTVSQNALTSGNQFIACGDFNGDGLMDVATHRQYWHNALPSDVDRLIAVDNGAGFIQQVSYKSITDTSVYTKGTGAAYPQVDMQTPIMVVSRLRSGNDTQGWQETSYRYAALRADLRRSGTQGFGRVTSTNENTAISVATHYHQSFPLTGLRSRVHKFLGTEAAPQTLEDSTFTYLQRGIGVAAPTPQAAQVHLTQSEVTQFDLRQAGTRIGTVRETAESFDPYGYPLRQRTEHRDAAGALTSSTTADHLYDHKEPNWLLGQLVRTTTSAENLRPLPSTTAPVNALTVQVTPGSIEAQLTAPGAWTGSVTASAAGGVGTHSYAWTKQSGGRISLANANAATVGLSATLDWNEDVVEVARVVATDSSGASVSQDVTIRLQTPPSSSTPLSVQTTPTQIQVRLNSPGTASASVSASSSGGYGTHSYAWNRTTGSRVAISNATAPNPTFSASLGWGETLNETYQLTVTDALGATLTQNVPIQFSVVNQLSSTLSPSGNVYIYCPTPIQKSVVAQGGVPPYSYLWSSSGSWIQIASPTSAQTSITSSYDGTVSVRVTDSAGSQITASFLIYHVYCNDGGGAGLARNLEIRQGG